MVRPGAGAIALERLDVHALGGYSIGDGHRGASNAFQQQVIPAKHGAPPQSALVLQSGTAEQLQRQWP